MRRRVHGNSERTQLNAPGQEEGADGRQRPPVCTGAACCIQAVHRELVRLYRAAAAAAAAQLDAPPAGHTELHQGPRRGLWHRGIAHAAPSCRCRAQERPSGCLVSACHSGGPRPRRCHGSQIGDRCKHCCQVWSKCAKAGVLRQMQVPTARHCSRIGPVLAHLRPASDPCKRSTEPQLGRAECVAQGGSLPCSAMEGKRVAVVGSGIAGLSAAWLLHRWAGAARGHTRLRWLPQPYRAHIRGHCGQLGRRGGTGPQAGGPLPPAPAGYRVHCQPRC